MSEKSKTKGDGWDPSVMSPEEALAFLDSKGIGYEICDTPVPVLANKVSCGVPKGIGDEVIDDYYHLPKSLVGLKPMIEISAQGDSMIDAEIYEGDLLMVELGAIARDGEIVVANIDGECTTKVFFTDDQQQKWLCPMNKKYSPILLTAKNNTMITGVVRHIMRKLPHISFSECVAIVNRAKNEKYHQGDVMKRLSKAVAEGSLLFWAASAWAVVYGVVRDHCGYEGSVSDFERKAENMNLPQCFEHPCSAGKVQRTISNHPYMRLHIDKWKENGASTRVIVLMEFLRKNL